jgi:hypothetical protein
VVDKAKRIARLVLVLQVYRYNPSIAQMQLMNALINLAKLVFEFLIRLCAWFTLTLSLPVDT